MSNTVKLIKPCFELETEYMDMVQDFAAAGESQDHPEFQLALEDFPAYIRNCKKWEKGIGLPDGWVPALSFWLIRNDNVILGKSGLRHELNDNLRKIGGHIGYRIRPSQRRKGYGNVILWLTLAKAKRLGIRKILVACDDDNVASAKIIERNGGVLKDKCDRGEPGKLTRRYWIDLTKV
jgi:predicted acetyltransferase